MVNYANCSILGRTASSNMPGKLLGCSQSSPFLPDADMHMICGKVAAQAPMGYSVSSLCSKEKVSGKEWGPDPNGLSSSQHNLANK